MALEVSPSNKIPSNLTESNPRGATAVALELVVSTTAPRVELVVSITATGLELVLSAIAGLDFSPTVGAGAGVTSGFGCETSPISGLVDGSSAGATTAVLSVTNPAFACTMSLD